MSHVAKSLQSTSTVSPPPEHEAPARRDGARRDGAATRQRLLQVALSEFAEHGHSGGRIDRTARTPDDNVRMSYHTCGNNHHLDGAAPQ